jgi:hypothetical protein
MGKDLRHYAKQTQTRLILGFLFLVFIVGDGLIFVFYGREASIFGMICIGGALVPVLIIALFLWIAERVVKSREQGDIS